MRFSSLLQICHPTLDKSPHTYGKVGVTLQDEEEFPILRKGGKKCFSQAFSCSGSECWSERDPNI